MEGFAGLARDARKMQVDNRQLVEGEVAQLEAKGAAVQRGLVVQAMALVPGALILSAIFTFLITRPIRQMDKAIRRLGDGDFSQSAQIVGPTDLEQLGERLDWMRTRLLEVEQDKNRFLHHISHELKTPLTAVREGAELLTEEVVGHLNSQQREIVAILRGNSLQLQKLIENLLDFNIASSRASQLKVEPVDLARVIESVLAHHKVATMARQLVLDVSLQPVALAGDRNKLQTLVDNLVSNAIKFSPPEGRLRVRLQKRGEQALIEVADSGPGIPPAERRRIFDAFYQGSSSATGHVRGTGLDLSSLMRLEVPAQAPMEDEPPPYTEHDLPPPGAVLLPPVEDLLDLLAQSFLGQQPLLDLVKALPALRCDRGRIAVDPGSGATSVPAVTRSVCSKFSSQEPATTSRIPKRPWPLTSSPRTSQPVTTTRTGVNARYGKVRANG